ncbi:MULTISPECIES: ABC-three component system middle component 6 [Desulfovibrionaceae]|uniref:Uncharacterized protein n=2 Tax=Halodesulfovibrio aestuarii TaxID=126333 RepID=A0A8G2CCB1_9BACT|nr:hypothetical protein SAMN05660830_03163 [Halodesulfovibrio aestuarii]
MIPSSNSCHESINVVVLGAIILEQLYVLEQLSFAHLIEIISEYDDQISIDYVILTCDWLYIINAIDYNSDGVIINAA